MITLHFIGLNAQDEAISVHKKINSLIDAIDELTFPPNHKNKTFVWLLAGQNEVIVSDKYLFLQRVIEGCTSEYLGDVFLQQYDNFEDAYAVALAMREEKENCYAPKKIEATGLHTSDK